MISWRGGGEGREMLISWRGGEGGGTAAVINPLSIITPRLPSIDTMERNHVKKEAKL